MVQSPFVFAGVAGQGVFFWRAVWLPAQPRPLYGAPVCLTQFAPGTFLLGDEPDHLLPCCSRRRRHPACLSSERMQHVRPYFLSYGGQRTCLLPVPLSLDLQPNSVVSYPPQTFTDAFVLNLPDGDLEGNTTPVNYQFPANEFVAASPIYGSDGNYYVRHLGGAG
jgi:hypothetical protein